MQNKVRQFHLKYGHPVSDWPQYRPDPAVLDLRIKLIEEETEEMLDALRGLKAHLELPHDQQYAAAVAAFLEEILDGAADSNYVIAGTMVTLGLPLHAAETAVHLSNMTKEVVPKLPHEKYGKGGGKGKDYQPPDIKALIERAGLVGWENV